MNPKTPKERLQRFKRITTWGGAATTLCGIVLSYATGGSLPAAGLSMFGLLITCAGHLIADAIAKHQAAEQKADRHRQADTLQASLDGAYIAPMPEKEAIIRQRIEELRHDT